MSRECIFCRIIQGASPGAVIHRDDDFVVLEDIAPKAPHHYLIVPVPHIPTILDLTREDAAGMGKVFDIANNISKERGFAEDGFRLVANCNRDGGQTVWHIHFHLLGGRPMSWPPG